jgi:hypothetical protein
VSKFHPIWCLVAQESKLGRKGSVFCTRIVNSFVVTRQVRSDIFSSIFDDYFECNFVTICLIDPILLLLGS